MVVFIYRLIGPGLRGFNKHVKLFGGLALTLPIMMLGWIPFRAESVSDAFSMWGRLFDLSAYTWLGMRENVYLVAALVMVGIFAVYIAKEKLAPLMQRSHVAAFIGDTAIVSIMAALVIIFLRPINQFIYFQF